MGTSGAYGGSGRQGWNRARGLLQDLEGGTSTGGSDGGDSVDDGPAADLWQAVADALTEEDPLLSGPAPADDPFPLADLLPRRRGPGGLGGGGGGGIVSGRTAAAGRRGSRSSRAVARGAARGGAAIGGAYALLRGDGDALADLGLDLSELRDLSPRMQCARILGAVLGEGGHPDDGALRRAAAEALKAIILSGQPPSEIDALRGFVTQFVFGLCLVEIQGDITSGVLDAAEAARMEKRLKRYIEARVRLLDLPDRGTLPIARFREAAAGLTRDAIRVLRAGRDAA